MATELVFTIGSMNFGVTAKAGTTFTGKEFVESVESFLEGLSNVEQLRVSAPSSVQNKSFEVPEAEPLSEEEKGPTQVGSDDLFPRVPGMTVAVDLHIPHRVQMDVLSDALRRWVDPKAERFSLRIEYDWTTALVTVVPEGATRLHQGQDAMVVVREFIQHALKKHDFLFLDTVGPTPFHADFFVKPETQDGREGAAGFIRFEHVRHHRGPDELQFFYDTNNYASADDAFEDVYGEIEEEARFFYTVARSRQYDLVEWARIQRSVDRLIDLHRRSGVRPYFARLFRGARTTNRVVIELSEFESGQLFDRQHREAQYRYHFVESPQSYLQPFVDADAAEETSYPTRQTSELVRSFERWRTHSVDAIMVVSSAVLGGVVGGLIALIFG